MGYENIRVLIAEDDRNTMGTLRMMLKELGVTDITEADNGDQAHEILLEKATEFDLVISDWNMPHKSGLELLKEVRAEHPDLPFIMVSARADINSIENALLAKVTSYIRKPFSLNDLESKITVAFRDRPSS